MKTKAFFSICLCLLVFALIGYRYKHGADNRTANRARGDVGGDLHARVTAVPKPALTSLPVLTSAVPVASAATAAVAQAASACLSEETLEPLRRAFVPPRFLEDPALPRERQTLLSNRRLISPEKRAFQQAVSGRQSPTLRGTTPFIVMFNSPVDDAARTLLTEAGAIVRGFYPNNAILAELTPAVLAELENVRPAQAASEYLPPDKLQPFLASLVASQPPESRLRVTVQTLAPEDAEPVAMAVRKIGGTVEQVVAGTRWGTVQAVVPLAAVSALAARGEVQWVEERPLIQKRNDKAASPSHLNTPPAWNTWGLTGKGQVVGHADTGLDTGVPATMHPDFQNRVRALIARGRPGDASDPDGHGTHTAGSILGSGAASDGQFRGSAWEAELVHQSVVNAYGYFTGLPADLYPLFEESYGYGACIHSDSWGSSVYGAYDSDCRSTDLFAWDHPDHLAVFSAGNDGRDSNYDGVVDTVSIGSPATAKNVLTVGATENDREPGSGGYSSLLWGTAWASRYPKAPIKTDYISYSATVTPVYRQGMAAFSSRGPTQDGRIKPEVVAPGTDVISTKSAVGGNVWTGYPANSRYCFGGGTSMSTPLMAGAAALMRQYAVERGGVTNPSAALLKAMLVGGARSLYPGQYGTNATQEIPSVSPNVVEGWGQPDLTATVHPEGRMVRLFDQIGPATGATNTFDITVTTNTASLDIALCWIDYPATAGAGVTRVNDLDLLVTAPDGTLFYPNSRTSRDTVNTLETLRLNAAEAGIYHVAVIGAAVPYSGGAAALYVRGAIAAPAVIVHTPLDNQVAGFTPYPVSFQVQALTPLKHREVSMSWTTGTANAPTGLWRRVEASWVSNAVYTAGIRAQPPATYVYYYLQAETDAFCERLPKDAPDSCFSFYVDVAVDLVVDGTPERFGTVTPPYGTNTQIATVPFEVSASGILAITTGVRRVCAGWTGTGDVPPQGATNAATLTISQASTLTWRWENEFALTSRYRLADTGQLFGETVIWCPENSLSATETALELGFVGSTPYAFCGWSVDGARWPDATSSAPNPANGIPMTSPRLAQGDYLPFWLDSDGNGLSDWWELRHFGAITNVSISAEDDPDGDNWTNLAEFLDNTNPNDAASVPEPPVISVAALAVFQTARAPWTVNAVITDNMSVELAFLVWREDGDTAWQTNVMSWVEGDTYTCQLAPFSHGARWIDYFVVAGDLIGYYAPEYCSYSALYSVIGDYETPWMQVTPDGFGIVELSQATTNLALTVANLAGPDLVWTTRVAAATAPFAATHAAWSHSGLNDVWCVTTNRTWNGDAVWYCGNPSTRTYPNGCHALLDTPPFRVGDGGGLLFRHWIKTEFDTGLHFWDGAVLRISTDNGATYSLIAPSSGYPSLITDNPDSPFPADHPCLAGDGEGWQTLLVDLSAYAGQTVRIRFEFGSDLYVIDEGWYIANVTPFSCDEPVPAWLSPNGIWNGTLPGTVSTAVTLTLDPSALAFDEEAAACLRVTGNDPTASPSLLPLTVRRGHVVTATANGPGTAAVDQPFLFRDAVATVTLQADPGCYLFCVFINEIPQPGIYDYTTTDKVFTFTRVSEDPRVTGWFTPRLWDLTISNPVSTATPEAGTYTLTNGTLVTASVLSPVPLANGIRRQCVGWQLTGHTPSAGTSTPMSFALTNHATLTWIWAYAHQLQALAGPNGTVAPTEGWFVAGDTAVVTSYPSSYYHLDTWSGDLSGATFEGDRVSFVIIKPRSVTASFAPNQTALRGVPEYWLASFGWTQNFELAAEADTDQDGMAAWAEWQADTDPTNVLSLLRLNGLASVSNAWSLSWQGGADRTQQVQRAITLTGPWVTFYTNPPPTPITNILVLPAEGSSGFYRISIP